jgi:hypothetical protein
MGFRNLAWLALLAHTTEQLLTFVQHRDLRVVRSKVLHRRLRGQARSPECRRHAVYHRLIALETAVLSGKAA